MGRYIEGTKIRTEAYKKWLEIMQWCNKDSCHFKDFTVCEEWKDFDTFSNWWDINSIKGLMFHYDSFHISPENCSFMDKKESVKIKIKNHNLRKYGVENFQSLDWFRNNRPKQSKESIEKRANSMRNRSKEEKEKSILKKKQTNIEKYGVEYPCQLQSFKDKTKKTCMEKYGTSSPAESEIIKEKIKKTNLEKYGVEYYTQTEDFIKRSRETSLEKYGANSYNESEEGRERLRKHSIRRGLAIMIDGKTLSQIAKEKGVAASCIHQNYRKIGDDVISYKKDETLIETIIKEYLESINIDFNQNKILERYIPDFMFNNTIIECDGLYWHSDLYRNNSYHKNKRKFYVELGYKPFFFREDEILTKLDIVKSIINNNIGINKRIQARRCKFQKIDKESSKKFFIENHLMGNGSGLCFGLYEEDLVAAMSVKKLRDGLDISRFACLNNHSVIGGFSKLLKNIERELNPKFIQTFIDLRYGSGDYLTNLGFIKETERVSFKWVKNDKTVHRMNFPGNTGYDYGYNKIWDCGQAKWVKYF